MQMRSEVQKVKGFFGEEDAEGGSENECIC